MIEYFDRLLPDQQGISLDWLADPPPSVKKCATAAQVIHEDVQKLRRSL
jgi:hypothetical protein